MVKYIQLEVLLQVHLYVLLIHYAISKKHYFGCITKKCNNNIL